MPLSRTNRVMAASPSLYGIPLLQSSRLSLADQAHDILLCQIQAGRWRIGERLPSIPQLAEEAGVSRRPIQQAFEALKEAGYIRQERGNGTFLAAKLARNNTSQGSIGVVMIERQPESQLDWAFYEVDHWRLHAILRQTAERQYTQEVRAFRLEDMEGLYERLGSLFSPQTRGIISMTPFASPPPGALSPKAIPLVFLGYSLFRGNPYVALDLETGFRRLTEEVIRLGHRRILLASKRFAIPGEMRLIEEGVTKALSAANLDFDREALEASANVNWRSPSGPMDFLEQHVAFRKPRRRDRPTAVICPAYDQAVQLIAAADKMGIRIPADLSVVSQLSGPMRQENPQQRITGLEYDLDLMVRLAFVVLEEQMRTRRNAIPLIRVEPLIEPGDSLAAPRSGA